MGTGNFMDMDGCVVRDENGRALAVLHEEDDAIVVRKMPCCSLGTYLYIVSFLRECDFDVK